MVFGAWWNPSTSFKCQLCRRPSCLRRWLCDRPCLNAVKTEFLLAGCENIIYISYISIYQSYKRQRYIKTKAVCFSLPSFLVCPCDSPEFTQPFVTTELRHWVSPGLTFRLLQLCPQLLVVWKELISSLAPLWMGTKKRQLINEGLAGFDGIDGTRLYISILKLRLKSIGHGDTPWGTQQSASSRVVNKVLADPIWLYILNIYKWNIGRETLHQFQS